ncbi:ribosome biogenesis protein BRX1 [Biomphalaria glabrata]|uniref:Ribosome biogenesis protein BRX1 homolog n=1 Tax=Biomphalaria glabrata TaxID=6526 RepID=A0A2C9M1A6_BIOGL|nr:ribosome biogenesis protein BRX1 homolog [Biomphalaria glabrata]KAI8749759.1 putative ribosome biogenesis protein BRX1 [Biomphalaria glabrata]KAI8787032.1 ribosome biogenesis protein BRX1 [Biomphalaria glabrata]
MAKRKQITDNSSSGLKPKKQKKDVILQPVVQSDAPVERQTKWKNKQRVLVFSSRGISFRTRHLMNDLRTMMPHSKAEPKMDRKDKLFIINEICEMKNCNKCLYFEGKKKQDVYLWASNVPKGPSAKFLVENIHTMSELKLTGNCLKGSRPLLSFDKAFNSEPHWMLLKELFVQIFGTPNHHPKSQPFIDHVFSFSIQDNRIWFRNYQILAEDGSLAEIGPRFVLNPIRIFASSFGGATLYQNPYYVSPNEFRRTLRQQKADKYNQRQEAKVSQELRRPEITYNMDPTDEVFNTITESDFKK